MLMRTQAQWDTRLHSGDLGGLEVVEGDDSDDAHCGVPHGSGGSQASKGRPGGPSKVQRVNPPPRSPPPGALPLSPTSPPLLSWLSRCRGSKRHNPSGNRGGGSRVAEKA